MRFFDNWPWKSTHAEIAIIITKGSLSHKKGISGDIPLSMAPFFMSSIYHLFWSLLMSHYPMSQLLMCRPISISHPAFVSLFSKNWWLNCTFGNANGHPGEGEYYSTSAAAATAKGLTRAQLPSKRQSSLTLGNKNSSIWTTTFV